MTTNVVMEALSPTMEEGRLVEWKKQEGDTVAVGDVLAEVETDKAVMELVARAAGTLLKHIVEAGATVPVSEPGGSVPPGEYRRLRKRLRRHSLRPDRIAPSPCHRHHLRQLRLKSGQSGRLEAPEQGTAPRQQPGSRRPPLHAVSPPSAGWT
jgi:pyruvate/2-oxoglutarate dehydrogenase complex dihydrolipoamide acyltransferase (E2) component